MKQYTDQPRWVPAAVAAALAFGSSTVGATQPRVAGDLARMDQLAANIERLVQPRRTARFDNKAVNLGCQRRVRSSCA